MNELRLVLAKVFRPHPTLKSITRLTSHRTHHGFGLFNHFFSNNKPLTYHKIPTPTRLSLSYLNTAEEGFKKLHDVAPVMRHSVHAIEMNNILEDIETVVSEEEFNRSSTNESFCFEEVYAADQCRGVIEMVKEVSRTTKL